MAILLKYREIVGAGTLASLLVQLSKRLRGLQEILADPAQTRFVVVTRAAALPAGESESLIASLRSLGIAVQAVIVNAVGAGSCPRCRATSQAETREIAPLAADGRRRRLRYHRGTCRGPPAPRRRRIDRVGHRLAANHVMAKGSTAVYLYCVVRAARRPSLSRVPAGLPGGSRPDARKLSVFSVAHHGRGSRWTSMGRST